MTKKKQTKPEPKPKPEGYVFGRPNKYKPEYCDMLIAHMSQGLSFESFAGVVKCDKVTIYNWTRISKDFLNAKTRGTEECRLFWEKLGVMGAAGKVRNFNPAAWIFNMKNRFKSEWRERQEVEHNIKPQIIERKSGETIILSTNQHMLLEEEQQDEDD